MTSTRQALPTSPTQTGRSSKAVRSGVPWWLPWGALALVLIVFLAIGVRPRHDQSIEDRVQSVAATLKCQECTDESVATSDAPFSQGARSIIRQQLEAGKSPNQIRDYFVARYGSSILLTPSGSGLDAFVWILPIVALVLGAGGLGFAFWRWRQQVPAEASAADRELVAREVEERREQPDDGSSATGRGDWR